MKLFLIAAIPLLAAGAYAVNATNVQTDISSISAQVQALQYDTQQVVAGASSTAFALQVELDAVNLKAAVVQATNDANASPAFGSKSSLTIGVDLISLKSTVVKSLQTVAQRRAQFGDLAPVVLYSLYDLKKTTDAFAVAVQKKLSPLEQAIAPAVVKSIDAAFQTAIAAYGGAKA